VNNSGACFPYDRYLPNKDQNDVLIVQYPDNGDPVITLLYYDVGGSNFGRWTDTLNEIFGQLGTCPPML
jgi:hypothetical protein